MKVLPRLNQRQQEREGKLEKISRTTFWTMPAVTRTNSQIRDSNNRIL